VKWGGKPRAWANVELAVIAQRDPLALVSGLKVRGFWKQVNARDSCVAEV